MDKQMVIDTMNEIEGYFDQFIREYGVDALKEPRRIIGFLLDIDSKMIEYAKCISMAYQMDIPNQIESGQIADENSAMDAVKSLSEKIDAEISLLVVESFGQAYGKQFFLRPDYSNGSKIPYKTKKSDGLLNAIEKLDHIRWFLNNYSHYKWNSGDSVLDYLREKMNAPQKNRDSIRSKYREIVHGFKNNPYEENIILEEEIHSIGFESNLFSDYFILIGDEPVSIEFAKYYGGPEFDQSFKSWQNKEKNFKDKVNIYREKTARSQIPDISKASYRADETRTYIIWSILILGAVIFVFKSFPKQIGLLDNFNMAKERGQNIIKILLQYYTYQNLKEYSVLLIVAMVLFVSAIAVLVSVLVSFVRARKAKKIADAPKLLNHDLQVFDKKIAKNIEDINTVITKYYKGESKKTFLKKQNYASLIKSISENRYGSSEEISKLKSVPNIGRTCRLFVVLCAILMFILTKTSLYSKAKEGSRQLNVLMERIEQVKDSYIMPTALEFNGHYYCLFDNGLSWDDAKNRCEAMGGNLAKITSKDEDGAVYNYLKECGYDSAFFGLKMIKGKKGKEKWYWITKDKKSKVKYTNWIEGEPSTGDNGDCIYGAYGESDESRWRALSGSYVSTYICEWSSIESAQKQ